MWLSNRPLLPHAFGVHSFYLFRSTAQLAEASGTEVQLPLMREALEMQQAIFKPRDFITMPLATALLLLLGTVSPDTCHQSSSCPSSLSMSFSSSTGCGTRARRTA